MKLQIASERIVVFFFLWAGCGVALAQAGSANSGALTSNSVFKSNCAKCHGETAKGRHFRGPALVSDKVAAASADDLRAILIHGKGHMPKFGGKLGDSDIDRLVQQIKAANQK
jgi:mono/diheme cytochrome c family protein